MSTPEDQIPLESETNSTEDGAVSTETGGTEPETKVPEPQVPPAQEPVTPSYAGTRIEGRTAEEAGAYIQLIEKTVREQADRITEAESTPAQIAPTPESEEVNFFDSPREVLRQEIAQAVAPLNKQIAAFQAQRNEMSAWTQIEQEVPDFKQYKHLVQQLVTGQGYTAADLTVDLLRNLYYTAVGWDQRHGGDKVIDQPVGSTPQPQPHIPQHRPSTAPLPAGAGGEPKVRELTENERHLAREWKMTAEEFVRLQDENLELENFSSDN